MKKTSALLVLIIFVMYIVLAYVIFGFEGHESTFLISFAFMLVAFLVLGCILVVAKKSTRMLKDWWLNYPLMKHSTIYFIAEFVLSTVFMVLDSSVSPVIAFVVQFITLGVYLVFALSCLMAKEAVESVGKKVKKKSAYMKQMTVDAEMLVEKCRDPEAKKLFVRFAEEVKYSDVMSNEALEELEKNISLAIQEAGARLIRDDIVGAVEMCNRASILLAERNKKTKVLK